MSPTNSELQQHLQTVLAELEKLSKQIRDSNDLSESAELVLCLRELVQEQISGGTLRVQDGTGRTAQGVESQYRENTGSSTHTAG